MLPGLWFFKYLRRNVHQRYVRVLATLGAIWGALSMIPYLFKVGGYVEPSFFWKIITLPYYICLQIITPLLKGLSYLSSNDVYHLFINVFKSFNWVYLLMSAVILGVLILGSVGLLIEKSRKNVK